MRQSYKTARCLLYRNDRFLLAVHASFWGSQRRRWGIPGGQIERGEDPASAAAREIEEELSIYLPELMEVGPFSYKRTMHMVYAARVSEPVHEWDESELLEIGWFSIADIRDLKTRGRLHADYELEAVTALLDKLKS